MEKAEEELIDFEETRDKLLAFLEKKENAVMVLATSADDHVVARSLLVVSKGTDLYFLTWKHSRKCVQIEKNNRVSLCKDRIEIEGKAEILGNIASEENKEILELLREKHPESVEKWKDKPNMVFVRVQPEFACVDGYFVFDDFYIECIDLGKQKAYRVKWANY